MFLGPLLLGSFAGYVAAGLALVLGLAFWLAALTLVATGMTATGFLLALLVLRNPLAQHPGMLHAAL
ncbi:MAG: hypothetical protein DI533_21160 [Cereibacter sphaeroides]|uniref:Uncharacterized protein n=1 Tax=Cereibacter sphaeroides TaxID=1063 RepID=A0A2W5TVV9_CERSP|nr:MAG: hypothetical protein DI533_21160 [Cereibacter sphaeroides]